MASPHSGSGAIHSATHPGPIVVLSGDPTHPPLMYWGRGRSMTLMDLIVGLGDFLQTVGITVVTPNCVRVAIPVSAQAFMVSFVNCWHLLHSLLFSCKIRFFHSFIHQKCRVYFFVAFPQASGKWASLSSLFLFCTSSSSIIVGFLKYSNSKVFHGSSMKKDLFVSTNLTLRFK